MEKNQKKERRSSILKPQQLQSVESGEVSTTITAAAQKRVSFHTVRTVQEYDEENTKIVHSPHNEPIKLHDTGSSTESNLTSGHTSVTAKSENAEAITDELSRTVENFAPVTTSTPLPRAKGLNDLHDISTVFGGGGDTSNDVERCNAEHPHSPLGKGKETAVVLDRISEEDALPNENLDVESMDISDSCERFPLTADATQKLFRRSTVMKPFKGSLNQSNFAEETLVSNATRRIFGAAANNRRSDIANETFEIDAEYPSMNERPANRAVDMDISFDDTQDNEQPSELLVTDSSEKLVASAFVSENEARGIEIEADNNAAITSECSVENQALVNSECNVIRDADASNLEEQSKNAVVSESSQHYGELSAASRNELMCDASMKSERNLSISARLTDSTAFELSSQLSRQHISDELLSSTRKTTLGSPAALPKKKSRLMSPKVILPQKTTSLLFGSPRISAKKSVSDPSVCSSDKRNLESTQESTASTDGSTDKVLDEMKCRLRRSLNKSGVFTLTELTATDMEPVPMLYDIPMPEPIFQPNDLSSHPSTAEQQTALSDYSTCVESSSLSSRRSEIATAAVGNESSFLTHRIDEVGFEINVRTIPCLRIKPNEQPQVVELKQLATRNLQNRLAEVVGRCKGLVSAELPNFGDRKVAECIRTLNPRKLSNKEASWFDVCYLMAQREWFMLRAALATMTNETLDELLVETKAEYEQRKQLAQSVQDYDQNHDEVMHRHAQLKLLAEAAASEEQNKVKYEQLLQSFRSGNLEIERKKLELTKKKGARLEALLKEYKKTKAEIDTRAVNAALRRAEFLRRYDEEMAAYRDLFSDLRGENKS